MRRMPCSAPVLHTIRCLALTLAAACNSGSVVAPPPPKFRNLGGLDSSPEFVR